MRRGIIKEPTEQETDLSVFQLFNSLNEEELNRLNYDKSCKLFERGSVIYREKSRLTGFYCITKGIVKVLNTGSEGKEQIIRFAKKGEIIGYRSLLSQELACTTAKVIDEAVLCHIPFQTVLFLIKSNWEFSFQMIQIICRELRESNNYITDIAQKTIRERLAEVLLLLVESFDLDTQNTLMISLTREELANMVGTAPESVIRLLSEFKHEKMIALKGRKITFLNIPGLQRVANF